MSIMHWSELTSESFGTNLLEMVSFLCAPRLVLSLRDFLRHSAGEKTLAHISAFGLKQGANKRCVSFAWFSLGLKLYQL